MLNFLRKKNLLSNPNEFPQFVGFFTAHTIWQLEGGENVVPLIAYQIGGERKLERVESERYEHAVASARGIVNNLREKSDYILLAYDGFLTLKDKKYEAIFIEAFKPQEEDSSTIHLGIPYRSAKSKEGLAIYRPKVIRSNIKDLDVFLTEFYKGVDLHQKAAEFWNKFIDQSQ